MSSISEVVSGDSGLREITLSKGVVSDTSSLGLGWDMSMDGRCLSWEILLPRPVSCKDEGGER